ncbi:hypothetical protein QFC20_006152 [Naganishia adeliensis]|uniref:Uncharacterized protein n=1 Tax=Naganishia adeliensis TaxID=92952 RepID=A0ACC2VFG2_9TREE|nr:hypothetical protein QFC20_006152 [Naganishia adeliensis]
MFNNQEVNDSTESTSSQTPMINNVEKFNEVNDAVPDVDWTEYFVPGLFTPHSPSDPCFEYPGFYEEVGEGKGKGCGVGRNGEGVPINNINIVSLLPSNITSSSLINKATMDSLLNYFIDGNQPFFDNGNDDTNFVTETSTAFQTVTAYNQAPVNAVAGLSTQIAINNDHINNINTMMSLSNNSDDDVQSHDEQNIDADHAVRHYWLRNNSNLRYQVRIGGRTLHLTAIQIEHRFMGVKSAIWDF